MKKIRLVLIGAAVVMLAVSAGYAQPQGQDKERRGGGKDGIFKELNLTPEQTKKLADNRKAHRDETEKLRAAMKEKQGKLQEALKNPAVTRAAVEPLANDIKSLEAQLVDQRINGIFAVKEILTPEQFAKFQEMTQKHKGDGKERFQQWREKRKGGARTGKDKESVT